MKLPLLTISFCYLFFLITHSQAQPNPITNKRDSHIPSKSLTGTWHQIDSTHYTIEFVDTLSEFTLKFKNHHPYYFSKDSIGNISFTGYYPQWPPLNCELQFISKDILKITYASLGVPEVSYLYVRSKK